MTSRDTVRNHVRRRRLLQEMTQQELAWTAHRRPRPTAVALLGIALVFFVVFTLPPGGLPWATRLVTAVLLIGPVLGSGLALLSASREDDADDDAEA